MKAKRPAFHRTVGATWVLGLLLGSSAMRVALADASYSNFTSIAGLALNGDASALAGVLRLSPANEGQHGSVYLEVKQHVGMAFSSSFHFRVSNGSSGFGSADGFCFLVQNDSLSALGAGGNGLGYEGIPNSLAVEFDDYQGNNDPNDNHLSVQTNGTEPNSASHAFSLASAASIPPIGDGNVHSAKIMYSAGVMKVFMDDALRLTASVDLREILSLDGSDAWIGFTASTGGAYANYDILDWSFVEAPISPPDCNENGLDDALDIDHGTSSDTNSDGIPDECQQGPFFCPATGNYYELVRNSHINWVEAKEAAESRSFGGHTGYLATITSREENDCIGEVIGSEGNVWFGASDAEVEGDWLWIAGPESGQPLLYSNWAPGEPNNTNNEEDYAEWGVGGWNDTSNRRSPVTGYVVEYGTKGMVSLELFVRGNVNDDQGTNIVDAISILNSLFSGGTLTCLDAADLDNDGVVNITDPIALLGFLFLGTQPPVAPFPMCGADPVQDALECESFRSCN
jgi:hypothetical protein